MTKEQIALQELEKLAKETIVAKYRPKEAIGIHKREVVSLYRHYDYEGILLYVGIANNIKRRTAEHINNSHWWLQTTFIRVHHYASRYEALEAEREAIIKERPMYNIIHSDDPLLPRQRAERYYD